MVFGFITKIGSFAVLGLLAAVFFRDAFSQGLGPALSGVGTGAQSIGGALSSIGGGLKGFFTGIGEGTAKLFDPLFTLRDLAGFNFNSSQEVGEGNEDPGVTLPPPPPGPGGSGGSGNLGLQEILRNALNLNFNLFGGPRAGDVARRDRGGAFFQLGQVGLGSATQQAQAALVAANPGLVTFDLEGNISQFGGIVGN